MKLIILFAAFLGASTLAANIDKEELEVTQTWQAILEKYFEKDTGRVRYADIPADLLEKIFNQLKRVSVKDKDENFRKALFINTYNAGMLYNIRRYVESKSIDLKSKAFTDIEVNKIKVSGGNIWNGDLKFEFVKTSINLDEIEHGLLRGGDVPKSLEEYKLKTLDPRIHSAVNCAALSCPRVREIAYTEKNVNTLLDDNMKKWLNDSEHFFVDERKRLRANCIIKWYYKDFEVHAQAQNLKGAGEYLAGFVDQSSNRGKELAKRLNDTLNGRSWLGLRTASDVTFFYNWRINDVRNAEYAKEKPGC